jgi:hypothetical protein
MKSSFSSCGNNTTKAFVFGSEKILKFTGNFCHSVSGNTCPKREYFNTIENETVFIVSSKKWIRKHLCKTFLSNPCYFDNLFIFLPIENLSMTKNTNTVWHLWWGLLGKSGS